MIQISHLSKKYKNNTDFSVLDLDLKIDEGEIFGLLGPNGAGKTTLISILSSLIKPTSGSFSINGLTFQKNANQLKQLIGIVPQEYALYPTLAAYENLYILGLKMFSNKKLDTFSGGMKRRVNLIASILHNPKVLFLDEPTVGVDVQSKNVIIENLKKLNTQGTTIIYTSHHLNEAEQFCTKVAIIDHGSIIIEGTPKNLISQYPESHNLEDVFLTLTGKALRDHA